MALSNLQLIRCSVPHLTGEKEVSPKRPVTIATTKALPLQLTMQVRKDGEPNSQPLKRPTMSRRDLMLSLTAASLSAFALFSNDPAEARVKKSENRRKIMEKLEKLREKAGLAKPKTEDGEPLPQRKELPPLPMPSNPLRNPVGALVEATLP